MQELIKMDSKQTISSREIAELTGKRHDHVLRDVKNLIEQEAINAPTFGLSEYIDKKGEKRPMYILDKEASLILATGYNSLLRSRIIKRWMELEAKEQFKIPETFADALKLAGELEEKRALLEIENKQLTPKAEYFDALVDTDLLTGIRDTAKEFGVGQKELTNFLTDNKYCYRDNSGNLRPYIQFTPKYFELKDFTTPSGFSGLQLMLTPYGKEAFRLLLKNKQRFEKQTTIDDILENDINA